MTAFRSLSTVDLNVVVRNIPKDLRVQMKEHRLFIAGGFIRELIAGDAPKDIDLFGSDAATLLAASETLAASRGGRTHTTDNAVTVIAGERMVLQFIHRWKYDDPATLLEELDFTVCQAAVWWQDGAWWSLCSEDFYPDLAARRLVYTYPQRDEEAGGSMMRVRKFLGRGWRINADSLGGIIARVACAVRWSDLRHDGTARGREQAAAKVITGLLREVDPLLIIDRAEFCEEVML